VIRGLPVCTSQNSLNRCVGESVKALLQIEAFQTNDGWHPPLSADFPWWGARVAIGAEKDNAPVFCRDALKYVARVGIPIEPLYIDWRTPPSNAALANAHAHRAAAYYAPVGLDGMKDAIRLGNAVTFAFLVPRSLPSSNGAFPAYSGGEQDAHQVVAYGFDDQYVNGFGYGRGAAACMNWWGRNWGMPDPLYDGTRDIAARRDGCFWVPYDVLVNPNLAFSFWTAHSIPLV
jgi:hypothetical protein